MTTLEPHPLSKLFPPISEEDFGKLAADNHCPGHLMVRTVSPAEDGANHSRR
jgi:hypothetical protein